MNLKFPNPLANAIGVIALVMLLNACSSDNNQAATNNTTKTVTQLPWEAITVPLEANLRAYVIIDGNTGTRTAMTIDTLNNTATASISGLSLAPHTVQFVYEYVDGATIYTVAQSIAETVDLTGGSLTTTLTPTYVTTGTGFDNDSDGLSNAYELAAGTNPGDASCVVGYSLLDSCTL